MKGRSSRAVRVSSLSGSLGKQMGTVAQTTMCFTVAGSAAILHRIWLCSRSKQVLEAHFTHAVQMTLRGTCICLISWLVLKSSPAQEAYYKLDALRRVQEVNGTTPTILGDFSHNQPGQRQGRGSLGKEGVVSLRRQDAAHCALCPAVRAQQGNSGPQLAAP